MAKKTDKSIKKLQINDNLAKKFTKAKKTYYLSNGNDIYIFKRNRILPYIKERVSQVFCL
jgi:hypothetical protein